MSGEAASEAPLNTATLGFQPTSIWRPAVPRIAFAVILALSLHFAAHSTAQPAHASNPKVRAITAFVRLDRTTWEKQVADALVVLRGVKANLNPPDTRWNPFASPPSRSANSSPA